MIKDDIKILDEINGSFISTEMLSADEVEVALVRARGLVMEFEMLSKNLTQINETTLLPELKGEPGIEEKARMIHKEADLLKKESELIDLEEDEVPKSIIDKVVHKNKAEEISTDESLPQNGKIAKGEKPEKPAGALIKEETMIVEEVFEKKAPDEALDDKDQLLNNLLSLECSESNFEVIPLKSIRDGIGINDRFLFIRELFNNEHNKYENTVAALDGFTSIQEAVGFLKQNFKWNKTESGEKFLALVKRRFTK